MHRLAVILITLAITWVYAKTTVAIDHDTGEQIGVIVTWQADDTEGTCLRTDGRVPWLEKSVLLSLDGSTPWSPSHRCVWHIFGRGK